jgi:hypothetical protein
MILTYAEIFRNATWKLREDCIWYTLDSSSELFIWEDQLLMHGTH